MQHCWKFHVTAHLNATYLMNNMFWCTVNSETFERVLFLQMGSFAKIKPLQKGENSLSFTVVGIACQSREFFTWQICLLTLFAKISEFTVCRPDIFS